MANMPKVSALDETIAIEILFNVFLDECRILISHPGRHGLGPLVLHQARPAFLARDAAFRSSVMQI